MKNNILIYLEPGVKIIGVHRPPELRVPAPLVGKGVI